VSYDIVWSTVAVNNAAGFLQDDMDGVRTLIDDVDVLATEPRPPTSIALGSPDLCRLTSGRYRVLYEIVSASTITVIHIGRLG
jgi:hypothetical protein